MGRWSISIALWRVPCEYGRKTPAWIHTCLVAGQRTTHPVKTIQRRVAAGMLRQAYIFYGIPNRLHTTPHQINNSNEQQIRHVQPDEYGTTNEGCKVLEASCPRSMVNNSKAIWKMWAGKLPLSHGKWGCRETAPNCHNTLGEEYGPVNRDDTPAILADRQTNCKEAKLMCPHGCPGRRDITRKRIPWRSLKAT